MKRAYLGWIVIAIVVGGCGSADEHPLGGPFGGAANAPSPSKGTPTAGDGTSDQPGTDPTDPNTDPTTDPPATGDGGAPPFWGNDAGTKPPPVTNDAGTPPPPPPTSAPTWTAIYNAYLVGGSPGNCVPCHSRMSTAAGAYSWLKGKGWIRGTTSPMVNSQTSRISWYGGDMPPNGPKSVPKGTADMNAWVAAGALQN